MRLQGFTRSTKLPHDVKVNYFLQFFAAPPSIQGVVVRARTLGFPDQRSVYVVLNKVVSEKETTQTADSYMDYWSPAVGSLTAPLFNPAGDKIVFRDGPATPERGEVSRLLIWDLKTRLLRYLTVGRNKQAVDLSPP